jgi:hypothetical protein
MTSAALNQFAASQGQMATAKYGSEAGVKKSSRLARWIWLN